MLTTSEKIRRVYTDLIRRRSRVIVTQPQPVALQAPPIFIIGPLRSGTTLLRYVLDSHSQICCPPESNYIGILQRLITDDASRIGLEAMGYDEEHVLRKVRELCIYFWGNYALAKGKPRWADKSTSHVDYLDFIQRIFPEAQFIMIYRNGLDQVHSLTRGGTSLDKAIQPYYQHDQDVRVAAIQYWIEKTQQMLFFEKRFPEKTFRIRYEDMCATPEQILRPIFEFLGEPWEEDVLHFYRYDHDKGPEHGRTVVTRGFVASKDNYLTWPKPIIKECADLAASTLADLGYKVQYP